MKCNSLEINLKMVFVVLLDSIHFVVVVGQFHDDDNASHVQMVGEIVLRKEMFSKLDQKDKLTRCC